MRQRQPLPRQPLPKMWLMTDERMGDALWVALERLPRGSGVVFRHYATERCNRRVLFARVRAVARRRRLVLLRGGDWCGPGADGVHGRGRSSSPVHSARELATARGASLIFVSPVFATRSHAHARTLGRIAFARLASRARCPVIALGGMSARAMRGLPHAYGWAGIDAFF